MIGNTLANYRILEQIGQGGMARVYKAYDPMMDRHVAIKVLPEMQAENERTIERFRREAQAIARLEHVHILPVYAFGEENGVLYLVMRYMPLGTLADRLARGLPSSEEAIIITRQIASALDYAHSQNILHRDVKPSNILLDQENNAFLTDFGVAKMLEASVDLTRTGGLLGTPAYMSPEQCMAAKDLTPSSDQYSLGVVLYEMLTGRTPYQADTPLEFVKMHFMQEPIPRPHILREELLKEADPAILKSLSREPSERYLSCITMVNEYEKSMTITRSQERERAITSDVDTEAVTFDAEIENHRHDFKKVPGRDDSKPIHRKKSSHSESQISIDPPDVTRILPPPFEWRKILPCEPAAAINKDVGGADIFSNFFKRISNSQDDISDTYPKNRLPMHTFWMAKYPITYAQFNMFLFAVDGYEDDRWWINFPKDYAKVKHDQGWKLDDHPRENVNWYESMAFCRWLTHRTGCEIRLPLENEWVAAAGLNEGHFPWGDDLDTRNCNTGHSGLQGTSPVTAYPSGQSSSGVVDMIGNVWEWSLSNLTFPEVPDLSNGRKTTMGGSWREKRNFRNTYRNPLEFSHDVGFRIIYDPTELLAIWSEQL